MLPGLIPNRKHRPSCEAQSTVSRGSGASIGRRLKPHAESLVKIDGAANASGARAQYLSERQLVGRHFVERSDSEVLADSRRNPEAFADIVRRHSSAVHGYLARRAGRQTADELLGEVWLRAFRSRHAYDTQFLDARPWLYGIARNTLRAHWRLDRLDGAGEAELIEDPWPDADARLDAREWGPALAPARRLGAADPRRGRHQPRDAERHGPVAPPPGSKAALEVSRRQLAPPSTRCSIKGGLGMDVLQLLEDSAHVPPPDDATIEAAVDLVLAESLRERNATTDVISTRRRTPRRRAYLVAAAAVLIAVAATAIPLVLGGGTSSAAPVLKLASYSFRLPTQYRLTSATTSACSVPLVVSFPSSGGQGTPTSPSYGPNVAAAASAAGGCISMVLVPPYTPTPSQPNPELLFDGAHPVRVGPYAALIRFGRTCRLRAFDGRP
jgi:hypothetical protein